MSRRLPTNPVTKLPPVEVWIERRFIGGSRMNLMARMVIWKDGIDGEGPTPIFGSCLLAPNNIFDVELAKRIVRRYLENVCDTIKFVIKLDQDNDIQIVTPSSLPLSGH